MSDGNKSSSQVSGQSPEIVIERVREPRQEGDTRILVDRLWPRGVSKEKADLDEWAKDATPSTELRKAIHSGDISWDEFADRYRQELAESDGLGELADMVQQADGRVTLLIAADPNERNHAQVLLEQLRDELKKR